MQRLAGQHVVVVGGGSGIGRAVAEGSCSAGARVTLIGRNEQKIRDAAAAIEGTAFAAADAAKPEELAAVFSAIGPFDHLVTTVSASSARLGVSSTMREMPLDAARAFFEGKFWGQYQSARAALDHLLTGGSITFTSGVAVRRSLPGHTIVAANNAAIEAAARQLAKEVAPIRVNVVSPGLTRTEAYDHLDTVARTAFFETVTAGMPLGRPAEPSEIADAYLFAMTAPYLTGVVIDIDGGFLVR